MGTKNTLEKMREVLRAGKLKFQDKVVDGKPVIM